MKTNKAIINCAIVLVLVISELSAQEPSQSIGPKETELIEKALLAYQPVGPKETEVLEAALRRKMAGYNCAFWPRPEKLVNAVSGKDLPEAYKDNIQKWLPRILNPSLMPLELDPNDWVGVRNLYFSRNHIIGRFSPNNDPNTVIEFKAAYRSLDITIHSKNLFDKSASEITNEKITSIIGNVLRIPSEKIEKIQVKSNVEKLADIDVCYGKMFCEWTEKSNPFKSERQWWSYIPFWYKEGTLYVSIATVEKNDLPHATIKEHWPF
jgi:hypothetical protein